jgi:polar amino acid transport system substrate-binding protein
MTNRRIALRLCFFALLLLAPVACQTNSGTWDRVKESGTLRVGLDPTYPPFEVADDNGVNGLDVDLAKALASELGIGTEFVYFGYDGLYDALATKQVDVLLSALVIMPERRRDFDYSEPYFNAGEILVVSSEENSISEMGDLDGRRLAVELGAQGHVEAIQWAKRLGDLEILPYGSSGEALEAVATGQADAGLVDSISGRLFLSEQMPDQPQLKRLDKPVTVEPYALVVRIEDEMLLVNLNEALNTLTTTGQLDQIIARWLDN